MDGLFENTGLVLRAIGWVFMPALALPFLLLIAPRFTPLKALSDGLIRLIDSLNYGLGEIIKWAIPALVLSVAFSVFALSIFGYSSTKLFESAEYLHASAILLGSAATLLAGQHVRVDIIHARMSSKAKALIDFAGFYALLMPVCLIILWASQSFVAFSWIGLEGSPDADGIRGAFLLKTLIPIFSVTMIMQGMAIALRAALCLNGLPRPERPGETPPLFPDFDASAP